MDVVMLSLQTPTQTAKKTNPIMLIIRQSLTTIKQKTFNYVCTHGTAEETHFICVSYLSHQISK